MPKKNWKGRPFGIFQHPFCCKTPKNWRGAFSEEKVFWKKSHSAEKMDPLVSSGIVCYAGNLFGSVPWANRYILASSEKFVELLVELFWSVKVVLKKTLTKSHDNSRLFSKEKRRLKRTTRIRKNKLGKHLRIQVKLSDISPHAISIVAFFQLLTISTYCIFNFLQFGSILILANWSDWGI